MRCLGSVLAVIVFGLASGLSHGVAAQGVVPSGYAEPADSLSIELRFRLFTTAYRWSSYSSDVVNLPDSLPDSGKRSLHLVPALGARFYPKGGHGVLVDADYRFDMDVDSGAGFLCLLDCPDQVWTEFVVAHVGYAYRYLIRAPNTSTRIAWTLTPHASVAAGASFTDLYDVYRYSLSATSPVVGARIGLDFDLHIKRFFMGWTLRYEILRHTKGPLRLSHFFSWNVIPVLAIGAVLGGKVQPGR